MLFETVDCNRRLSQDTFAYYRCPSCGLVFLSPVPSNLGDYYPRDYYSIPGSLEQLASQSQSERYKIDLIRRFVPTGRLLEIGPAYGGFAYLAQQAGFEVDVIEMDAGCCQFLKDVVGIHTINSADASTALIAIEPCNVIVLWHVLEHLPDPWHVLASAARRLVPGGVLVVATPNPESFQFRVLGRFWAHVDAPRHLELIPSHLLVQQMEAHALRPVLLTATDQGSVGWNSFGWAISLSNFFRHRASRSVAHLAGRLLAKMLLPVEQTGWRGSAYTAIFRKD